MVLHAKTRFIVYEYITTFIVYVKVQPVCSWHSCVQGLAARSWRRAAWLCGGVQDHGIQGQGYTQHWLMLGLLKGCAKDCMCVCVCVCVCACVCVCVCVGGGGGGGGVHVSVRDFIQVRSSRPACRAGGHVPLCTLALFLQVVKVYGLVGHGHICTLRGNLTGV